MNKYSKTTRWIAETVSVTLFAVVLLLQLANILFRYTKIATPLMWVEEFTRYAFIWIVFLVWHLSDRMEAHFNADFATDALNPTWRRVQRVLHHVLVIAFSVVTIWSSIRYIPATLSYSTNSFPWLPMGVVYLVIPIGLALVGVEHFLKAIRVMTMTESGDEPE